MNKFSLVTIATLLGAASASADIVVNLAQTPPESMVEVTSMAISDMQKPRAERNKLVKTDSLSIVDNKVTIPTPDSPAQIRISLNKSDYIGLFTAPGENITIDVTTLSPLAYRMKGSALLESISALNDSITPILQEISQLRKEESPDNSRLQSLFEKYYATYSNFIAANPESPAVAYAILNLESEDAVKSFESMTDAAKSSILMPLAQTKYENSLKSIEQEKKQQFLQSGNVEAPAFTLKNLDGKELSISDFRGKWVILDFWGTWCPWCIKGFPALKEAYSKYAGKLEILGIDCGDSEEQWRNGVKRFDLPWVHLYKPENETKILQDYGVQGYPTKVIVNPEGKIANITVGEDPDFFNILAGLIGE